MKIFLAIILITLLSPLSKAGHLPNVENIFQPNVTVKPGDIIQCEIKKTNLEETKNNYNLLTQECTTGNCYIYQPVSEKCFSFKVKALHSAYIMLSSIPNFVQNKRLEVRLDAFYTTPVKFSCIQTVINITTTYLSQLMNSSVINDKEYSGFWIKWSDDQLLEVGRESETIPFLHYQFPQKLQIKFVGIMSLKTSGEWIIDGNPKCPGTNGTTTQRKMKAESDCFTLN